MTTRAVFPAMLISLVASLALALPAQADFGLQSFSATTHDAAGNEVTQAGAHADSTVAFMLDTAVNDKGQTLPDGSLRNVTVELPPGVVGNPEATAKCTHRDFRVAQCSPAAMVGIEKLLYSPFPGIPPQEQPAAVYNLVPPDDVVAQLGFQITNVSAVISVRVRSDGGYNLAADLTDQSSALQIFGSTLTLWGVPADHNGPGPNPLPDGTSYGGPGGGPRLPFMSNPTVCGTPLVTTIRASSWQRSDTWASAADAGPAFTGCDQLGFDPSIDAVPTTTAADAPAGYAFAVHVPQSNDPDGLATPALRDATFTLPEGVSVSPSSAAGLLACDDASFALHALAPATCPPASRIGSVEIETPVLDEPLTGGVYVGQPLDSDPQSGRMFRIFVEARAGGIDVKLLGAVRADPATGRLTATFENNPQLPFSTLELTFDGGPRATLANPPTCGAKTTVAALTPWSGAAAATPSSSFAIDCPGATGFAPLFRAGAANAVAGAFSPFLLALERADREEYLSDVSVELPDGLLAKLRGVPTCPSAQADAGTCGIESRVGSAVVGAGPGAAPFFTAPRHGSVYLTEGYKGAPYGLAVVVRAIAGPYDLGTVVVRQAVRVDPTDAQLTVASDPLPTIVAGVPLRLRSVDVRVDRPGFTVNPTSCSPTAVRATVGSAAGTHRDVSQRFQVGDCRRLAFRPRLGLELIGRKQMRDAGHPGLRAVLTQGTGQANVARAAVKLPRSLALDAANAQQLCELADGAKPEPTCPKASIVGHASARTPLLDRPLSGPVYFVKNVRIDRRTKRPIRTLPSLVIPLRGEIAINLRANASVEHGKLVSTFATVPDAPISRFELRLDGGRHGILVTNGNLCRRPRGHLSDVELDAHNRKRADARVRFATPCKQARR